MNRLWKALAGLPGFKDGWVVGPLWVLLLAPHERDGETRQTDPTRPFGRRAGSFLDFGVGGYWGVALIEVDRPRHTRIGETA